MAEYHSNYTGSEIDAGIAKANTAVQPADLADYQAKIDSSNKLSADLVDDTSTTNKFVTAFDKTTWNGKSVVSGTNNGTNWTSITIDGTTKNIPTGGGSGAEEIYPIAITATPNSTNIELAAVQNLTMANMPDAPGYTAATYTLNQGLSYSKPYDSVLVGFMAGHQYVLPLISADSSMLMYGIAENDMPVFDADHPCAILIQLNNGAIDGVMLVSNSEYGPDGTSVSTSLAGYFYSDTAFSFNAGGVSDTDITTAISAGKIPVAIIDWKYKDYQSWCPIKSFNEEDYEFEGEYKGNKFTLKCDGSAWSNTWSPVYVEDNQLAADVDYANNKIYFHSLNAMRAMQSGLPMVKLELHDYTASDRTPVLDYLELNLASQSDDKSECYYTSTQIENNVVTTTTVYVTSAHTYSSGSYIYIKESGGGTNVVANPTLAGTEPELEGITIENTDYAVKGIYPTDLNITTEGRTIIVHKDTELGDSTKTKAWAQNTTAGRSWWLNNIPAFKEVIGKPLNSFSAFFNSTGTFTLYQADIEIDCSSNTMTSQAATADASASVFVTLTISAAEADGTLQTFLLDGTDSRVTFGSGVSTHPICPKTLGIPKNGGPKVGFNNQTNAVKNTTEQTILSGFSQESSVPTAASGYYQSFMFFFNYDDTVTEDVAILDLDLSDNTTLSCELSGLAVEPKVLKPLKGKYLSLIGDSITTYATYKPDSSYNSRYPAGVIQNVDQTWWKQLADYTEMNILRNTAYNGSTVTGRSDSSGGGHSTSSTTDPYAGCSDKRINDLSDGTNNPDIVICYIGINDFGTNRNVATGTYDGLSTVPADSSTGMATFTEGYGLMIKKIMAKYPQTKVYCCTLPSPGAGSVSSSYVSQYGASAFPVYNSTTQVHLADYNNAIRTLAHNMGAGIIEFAETVNWWNTTTYIEDGVHPNIEGMKLLARKAIATLTADAVEETTTE